MENKKLGIIIVFISLVLLITLAYIRYQFVQIELEGGATCPGEESGHICPYHRIYRLNLPIYVGIAVIFLSLGIGIYMIIFDRADKELIEALREKKKKHANEERFGILLEGLDDDEKIVIKAIKEQDGISQTTLAFRTDFSKAKLSVVLKGLEHKNLIKKVKGGKINKIYFKKAF